jgi:hypothetical protein
MAAQGGELDFEAAAGLRVGGPSRRDARAEDRLTPGVLTLEDGREELGRSRDQIQPVGGETDC